MKYNSFFGEQNRDDIRKRLSDIFTAHPQSFRSLAREIGVSVKTIMDFLDAKAETHIKQFGKIVAYVNRMEWKDE